MSHANLHSKIEREYIFRWSCRAWLIPVSIAESAPGGERRWVLGGGPAPSHPPQPCGECAAPPPNHPHPTRCAIMRPPPLPKI